MTDEYCTVVRSAATRMVVYRSEFLAYVREVGTAGEARSFLASIREQHRQATHNCSAYRLGCGPGAETSFDDDGEPRGTAGRPILGAVLTRGLTNVIVVVTRYFGGKKLGVRGLIEAYGGITGQVLDLAGTITRILQERLSVSCGYPEVSRVMYLANSWGAEVVESRYTGEVHLVFGVRQRDAAALRGALEEVPGVRTGP